MRKLNYNGRYGTIEVDYLATGTRFIAKPVAGKEAAFQTARMAMDYLRKKRAALEGK